jgi:hypothetical protein
MTLEIQVLTLGQAQECGRVKPFHGIPTLSLFRILLGYIYMYIGDQKSEEKKTKKLVHRNFSTPYTKSFLF